MSIHKKALVYKKFGRIVLLLFLPFVIFSCSGDQSNENEMEMDHEMEMGETQIETSGEAVMHGDLHIESVWSRPSFSGSNAAAYLMVQNQGEAGDRLVGVTAVNADAVEIHQTTIENDVMQMRPVTDGLEIPASGHVQMAPGGYHIMLVGISQDLVEGDTFPIMLHFETAGDVEVVVEVIQP